MDTPILTDEGIRAIEHLQHKEGSLRFYMSTLSRIQQIILFYGDEIGMSDTEAVGMLRGIGLLMHDLSAISGKTLTVSTDTDEAPICPDAVEIIDDNQDSDNEVNQ